MELELVPKDEPEKRSANAQTMQDGPMVYTGPERRAGPRRMTVDRRSLVRFESNLDRRHGGERRMSTGLWRQRDF